MPVIRTVNAKANEVKKIAAGPHSAPMKATAGNLIIVVRICVILARGGIDADGEPSTSSPVL
jgi:hypothetical protein